MHACICQLNFLWVAIRGFLVRRKFTAEKHAQEKRLLQIIHLQAGMTYILTTS